MLGVISLALQAGSMLYSGIAGSRAAAANRRVANRAANDVLTIAEDDVLRYQRDLSQLFGQQRIGAAAQGLDVGFGTNATIRDQTRRIGEEDIRRIRENARRTAWGIRATGDINFRAAMNQANANFAGAGLTLLSAVPDAWSAWNGSRARRDMNARPLDYYNAGWRR